MRAKSLFCLSVINITHVHCNIYSNIIQVEKNMEEYCLFLSQLWFRFDDGAEDEPLPVTQSSHQPRIVFGCLGLVRTRFLPPTSPLCHGPARPGETWELSLKWEKSEVMVRDGEGRSREERRREIAKLKMKTDRGERPVYFPESTRCCGSCSGRSIKCIVKATSSWSSIPS